MTDASGENPLGALFFIAPIMGFPLGAVNTFLLPLEKFQLLILSKDALPVLPGDFILVKNGC